MDHKHPTPPSHPNPNPKSPPPMDHKHPTPPSHPNPNPNPNPNPHTYPYPHPHPHPHPQPLPYGPYPYPIRPARGSRTTSCVLAFSFLLIILVAVPIVLFFLFRPHDPSVRVNAVKFPGLSVFSLSAAVRNPNRDAFSHYDSTIKLFYGGDSRQIGFMYIPAGEIGGGRTMNMDATFNVDQIATTTPSPSSNRMEEVELRVEMKGKVRVLRVFMHRVRAVAVCRVAVAAVDGKVMGARCTSSSN